MDYPFWDTSIPYGWLMGFIATFHVFISHFAIGGGLFLVVSETIARKNNDIARLQFLRGVTKFFVLTTLVMGALTGVGIWFIIGLLNPTATSALIGQFVWVWAIEWTFFLVEIAAAIAYYYGWERMSAKDHIRIGWIYFISAWMSLFAINGILGFMLTPGDWLQTGNVWDGFFNPTFWSVLILRTGICIMLAGIYTMMVASRESSNELKGRLVRSNAWWGIAGLAILWPSIGWFWSSIPAEITEAITESMPTTAHYFQATYWWLYIVGGMIAIFGLIVPKRLPFAVSLLIMIVSLVWFGQFEFFRESARKPYAITGLIYGNGIKLADAEKYEEQGLLNSIVYRTGDDGADLFRHYCRSCHTLNSYKPLKPAFDGTNPEFIAQMIIGMEAMRGNMPPFLGTEEEAAAMADHLWSQMDQRPFEEVHPAQGVELGQIVYDNRCGRCHVIGGFNDKTESLVDLDRTDYEDLLDEAGDYADEMPDFTGSELEREALIEYLLTLSAEEEN